MLPKHLGRFGASVRARSGSGGLEDRNAANYTSLAGSWLRESNPLGASYQDAPRPTATSVWWSHWVTLPVVLLARQNSSLLRLTPWRAWKDSNLRRRIWNPFRNLCSDPQRLVGKSNPSPPLDRRVSTPADSRGTERSRRESNAQLLLRRQRGRAAGESLGDVRVSIPSKMHSQCTGFASSLTSQSERWESNPPVVLIPNQVALLEPALRWWFRSESNRRLSLFRRALSPGQLPNRE
jgi:hypothetical protein